MKFKFALLGFLYYFLTTASYAEDLSMDKLRTQFSNWQKTYSSLTDSEQIKLLKPLKNYPLYPYAQYQYLQAHLDTITPKQVNQFSAKNSDTPLAKSLIQSYLQQLTKQKKWQDIKKLNIDNSIASQCYHQYALFQQGKKEQALKPIKSIWLSGSDLPSACDPIFNEWSKSKEKTANTILLRIELSLQSNNQRLAKYLTEQLPDSYKTIKKNLLTLYNNPKSLGDFSKNISPTLFSKQIVNLSFSRFANSDPDNAKKLIPTLVKRQKLSREDEKAMYRTIANNYFNDSATDEQIKWREQFIVRDKSTSLVEKQIRLALKRNNMTEVAKWLKLLSKEDSQKDEWQYWQAMVLLENNQQAKANNILNQLIKNRSFYAIYSAQKLNRPYQLNLNYSVIDTLENKSKTDELSLLQDKYKNDKTIQRINELRFWQMNTEAAKEWRNYLYTNLASKQYAELARYTHNMGWGEYAVQATIAGKLWNNWTERLPIVYEDIFTESLQDKAIPFSYAIAIARQESALDPSVSSSVGARGLMQLMPGTAKDTAKKIPNLNYSSSEQLYDPQINIKLGTYYLNYVYQLFDNNRILASAGYNAGPNRVARWLKETGGTIDAIAFIESIPFAETRNYVKSVLVYDYIYSQIQNSRPETILRGSEIEYKY